MFEDLLIKSIVKFKINMSIDDKFFRNNDEIKMFIFRKKIKIYYILLF
jgi:hypothetical protein